MVTAQTGIRGSSQIKSCFVLVTSDPTCKAERRRFPHDPLSDVLSDKLADHLKKKGLKTSGPLRVKTPLDTGFQVEFDRFSVAVIFAMQRCDGRIEYGVITWLETPRGCEAPQSALGEWNMVCDTIEQAPPADLGVTSIQRLNFSEWEAHWT